MTPVPAVLLNLLVPFPITPPAPYSTPLRKEEGIHLSPCPRAAHRQWRCCAAQMVPGKERRKDVCCSQDFLQPAPGGDSS